MDLAKDPGCDRAWAKGTSLMVNDCLNRFWLLARAVEDNGSPLRTHRGTTVSVVKGFAIAGLWPRRELGFYPAHL